MMTRPVSSAILQKNKGDGIMVAKLARGTFLLTVAVMFAVWAVGLTKSAAQAPVDELPAEPWSIYC
jgi:hypothetical protein